MILTHVHATRYNVGDDAIVMAIHQLVTRECSAHAPRFIDVTRDDFRRPGDPVVDFLPLYRFHEPRYWWKTFRSLLRSNAVVIGGGEVIPGSVEYMGIALLAKLLLRPVVFIGVGADFHGESSRLEAWYIRLVLRLADRVVVRDPGAVEELARTGMDMGKVVLAADVVLTLADEPAADRPRSLRDTHPGAERLIGVSLRRQRTADRRFGDREITAIAEALDAAVEAHDAAVVFFPFVDGRAPYEVETGAATDRQVIDRCIARMRHPGAASVYSCDVAPGALQAVFRELDVIVAMRLHANILAYNAGLRPIALNYAPKVERILSMLGLRDNLVHLGSLSAEDLTARIDAALAERPPHGREGQREALRNAARLNVTAVRETITRRPRAYAVLLVPLFLLGILLQGAVTRYARQRNPRVLSMIRRIRLPFIGVRTRVRGAQPPVPPA